MQWKWIIAITGVGGLTLMSRSAVAQQYTYNDVLDSNSFGPSLTYFGVDQVVVGSNGAVGAVVEVDGAQNTQAVYYSPDSGSTLTEQATTDSTMPTLNSAYESAGNSTFSALGTLAISSPVIGSPLLTFDADTTTGNGTYGSTGIFQINTGSNSKSSLLYAGDNYPSADNSTLKADFNGYSVLDQSNALATNSSGTAVFAVGQNNVSTTTPTIAQANLAGATVVTSGNYFQASPPTPLAITDNGLVVYQDTANGASGNATQINEDNNGATSSITMSSIGMSGATAQLLAAASVGATNQVLFAATTSGSTNVYLQKTVGGVTQVDSVSQPTGGATISGALSSSGNAAFTLPDANGNIQQLDYQSSAIGSTLQTLVSGIDASSASLVSDPNNSSPQYLGQILDGAFDPIAVNNNGYVLFAGSIGTNENPTLNDGSDQNIALLAWNPQNDTLSAVAAAGDIITLNGQQVYINGVLFNSVLNNGIGSSLATASNDALGANDTVAFGIQYSPIVDGSPDFNVSDSAILTTSLDVSAVPEPTMASLLFISSAPLILRRRRQAKR